MAITDKNYITKIFARLGKQLSAPDENLAAIIAGEANYNGWFTPESVQRAVKASAEMLNEGELATWLEKYRLAKHPPKCIGLILAGNIPMVGFHDILCALVTGNIALIKLSSQDLRLIKYVLGLLTEIEPAFADRIIYTERLENFDAVIATGSNNTSRYFDYYFGKMPNIIRKNRNSVALVSGYETSDELARLGHDIFDYYGLGCRNVSSMLVPEGYDFTPFFEAIECFHPVGDHHKFHNNYDYNKAIYLVNRDKHLDNGFLLLKEDERLTSPLAVLFFQYYKTLDVALERLNTRAGQIQCVVSQTKVEIDSQIVPFGQSQYPKLWDYADGIDTMQFLSNL